MYTMPIRGSQTLEISADTTTNFDIGPWVFGGQALLTIVVAPGVTVNSTDATLGGAIYSSVPVDPARSRVDIINNGIILGCNGAGGNGASGGNPTAGKDGCSGIDLNCDLVITNLLGQITAGGGGGGGGGLPTGTGGGGNPGGSGGSGSTPAESAQYGPAAPGGGVGFPGGACNGAGLAGDVGAGSGGAGGAAGYAINTNGNTITWLSGAANIIGGLN